MFESPRRRGAPSTACPRILLAGEDEPLREWLKRLLAAHWSVEVVSDGAAALASARQHAPDLVFETVRADGPKGLGLLRRLRADPSTWTVPVILCASVEGEASRLTALEAGADDYLSTWVSGHELLGRVAAQLGTTAPHRLDGLRVVVADDEPDAREAVVVLLRRAGAHVTPVSSAAAAVAAVERERPHLLLSDIGMPGEDGYSLIRRVRSLPPDRGGSVPAAALTAYASWEDRLKALAAGFQEHLAKPVEPSRLIRVSAALARGRCPGTERTPPD